MSAIPISRAPQAAMDRFQEVLGSELFRAELRSRESGDYQLPPPELWVQCRLNLARHWRALNVSEVLGVIHPVSPSDVLNDYSGGNGVYSRMQRTPYDIGILLKAPDAFPLVEVSGRALIDDEWMQRRVELYRGALLEVVPRYAPDREFIHDIYIESSQADLFEVPELGRYAHATVTFTVFQDVLINTW